MIEGSSLGLGHATKEVIVYRVMMYANTNYIGHELYGERTAYLFIIRRFWPNL